MLWWGRLSRPLTIGHVTALPDPLAENAQHAHGHGNRYFALRTATSRYARERCAIADAYRQIPAAVARLRLSAAP